MPARLLPGPTFQQQPAGLASSWRTPSPKRTGWRSRWRAQCSGSVASRSVTQVPVTLDRKGMRGAASGTRSTFAQGRAEDRFHHPRVEGMGGVCRGARPRACNCSARLDGFLDLPPGGAGVDRRERWPGAYEAAAAPGFRQRHRQWRRRQRLHQLAARRDQRQGVGQRHDAGQRGRDVLADAVAEQEGVGHDPPPVHNRARARPATTSAGWVSDVWRSRSAASCRSAAGVALAAAGAANSSSRRSLPRRGCSASSVEQRSVLGAERRPAHRARRPSRGAGRPARTRGRRRSARSRRR